MSATTTLLMSCSFGKNESVCGSYKQYSAIIPLSKCERDITNYLKTLGVSFKRSIDDETRVSEKDLILNRYGMFGVDKVTVEEMTICPKHRVELTLEWPGGKRKTCSFPSHKGQRKQLKSYRRVNASMSAEIFSRHGVSVPIGSGKFFISCSTDIVLGYESANVQAASAYYVIIYRLHCHKFTATIKQH